MAMRTAADADVDADRIAMPPPPPKSPAPRPTPVCKRRRVGEATAGNAAAPAAASPASAAAPATDRPREVVKMHDMNVAPDRPPPPDWTVDGAPVLFSVVCDKPPTRVRVLEFAPDVAPTPVAPVAPSLPPPPPSPQPSPLPSPQP